MPKYARVGEVPSTPRIPRKTHVGGAAGDHPVGSSLPGLERIATLAGVEGPNAASLPPSPTLSTCARALATAVSVATLSTETRPPGSPKLAWDDPAAAPSTGWPVDTPVLSVATMSGLPGMSTDPTGCVAPELPCTERRRPGGLGDSVHRQRADVVAELDQFIELFGDPYSGDRARLGNLLPDAASCVASLIRATDGLPARLVGEPIARVLRSPYWLKALLGCAKQADAHDRRFIGILLAAWAALHRVACAHGEVEPGSTLHQMIGEKGLVSGCRSKSIRSLMHVAVSEGANHRDLVRELPGAIDAAIDLWDRCERLRACSSALEATSERSRRRRDLLLNKGYGPHGRNNLYSALTLSEIELHKLQLLESLRHYNLVPNRAECLEKRSTARGRLLDNALALFASRTPVVSTLDQTRVWLQNLEQGVLNAENLLALRNRCTVAAARAIRDASALESALVREGLR